MFSPSKKMSPGTLSSSYTPGLHNKAMERGSNDRLQELCVVDAPAGGVARLHGSGDIVVATATGFIIMRNVASRRRYPSASVDLAKSGFPCATSSHSIYREEESGVRTFGACAGAEVVVAVINADGSRGDSVVVPLSLGGAGENMAYGEGEGSAEPEWCTSIVAKDQMVLVGTSFGRLFGVSAAMGAVHELQANRSFLYDSFLGLYSSGVKALGLDSAMGLSPMGEVARLVEVSGSTRLALALGSTGVAAMWAGYRDVGRERELWRVPLASLVTTDLGTGTELEEVMDLLAVQGAAGTVTLLVLTLVRGSSRDLVVSVLDVTEGETPQNVSGRLLLGCLAPNAVVPNAALHLDRESLGFYATWTRVADGDAALFAAHVDVTAARNSTGAGGPGSAGTKLHLDAHDVYSTQAIRGVGGVCYLATKGGSKDRNTDAQLVVFSYNPPAVEHWLDAPEHASPQHRASPSGRSDSEAKFTGGRKRVLAADATCEGFRRYLGSVLDETVGEAGAAVVLSDLLELATTREGGVADGEPPLTPESASEIIVNMSTLIMQPYAFGHSWGTDGEDPHGDGVNGALALYDTIHRLLASKVSMHSILVRIARRMPVACRSEAIMATLVANHGAVLTCAGLSSGILNLYQRTVDKGDADATQTAQVDGAGFVGQGALDAIQLLRQCMIQQVELRGGGVESLQDSGRTIEDAFFSDIHSVYDGIEGFAKALEAHVKASSSSADCLPGAYCIASALLSTIQSVEGEEDAWSPLSMHPKFQSAVAICLRTLHMCCDTNAPSTSGAGRLELLSAPEGARLTELVKLFLSSFHRQAVTLATGSSGGGLYEQRSPEDMDALLRNMDASFKASLQTAKETGIGLLLRLRLSEAAFTLSQDFLYPAGLLDACGMNPHLRLGEGLANIAGAQGTNTFDMATSCFHILEKGDERAGQEVRGRAGRWGFDPATIVHLGIYAPDQFESFKQSRPHLQWLHGLQGADFASAAAGAMAHAEAASAATHTVDTLDLETLEAVSSVAKLSAFISRDSDVSAVLVRSSRMLEEIKAQQWLETTTNYVPSPPSSSSSSSKMPGLELIDRLLIVAEEAPARATQTVQMQTSGDDDAGDSRAELAVRMALTLLSHWSYNWSQDHTGNESAIESIDSQSKGSGKGKGQGKGKGREKKDATVDVTELLVRAWAVCIRADAEDFGKLSSPEIVGGSKETEERLARTMLFRMLVLVAQDQRQATGRGSTLLSTEGPLVGRCIQRAFPNNPPSGSVQRSVRTCISLALTTQ